MQKYTTKNVKHIPELHTRDNHNLPSASVATLATTAAAAIFVKWRSADRVANLRDQSLDESWLSCDLPPTGDARTHIGLLTFDSGLHFYKLDEERGPRMLLVNDIEDVFLPDHAGLIVNLEQHRETVEDLLNNLPNSFPTESGVEGNVFFLSFKC